MERKSKSDRKFITPVDIYKMFRGLVDKDTPLAVKNVYSQYIYISLGMLILGIATTLLFKKVFFLILFILLSIGFLVEAYIVMYKIHLHGVHTLECVCISCVYSVVPGKTNIPKRATFQITESGEIFEMQFPKGSVIVPEGATVNVYTYDDYRIFTVGRKNYISGVVAFEII